MKVYPLKDTEAYFPSISICPGFKHWELPENLQYSYDIIRAFNWSSSKLDLLRVP